MPLDEVRNFAKGEVDGLYASGETEIQISPATITKFPDPTTDGAFNVTWWNITDYADPTADPNIEIIRVTGKTGTTWTIERAQEGTADTDKNIVGKTYLVILTPTKKTIDDIRDWLEQLDSDIVAIEADISNLNDDVADIQGDIISLDAGLATAQGNIATLQSDVSDLQGDVSTLQGDVSTLQSDVSTLQGDLATAQGDISTLQGQVSGALSDISDLQTDVGVLQGLVNNDPSYFAGFDATTGDLTIIDGFQFNEFGGLDVSHNSSSFAGPGTRYQHKIEYLVNPDGDASSFNEWALQIAGSFNNNLGTDPLGSFKVLDVSADTYTGAVTLMRVAEFSAQLGNGVDIGSADFVAVTPFRATVEADYTINQLFIHDYYAEIKDGADVTGFSYVNAFANIRGDLTGSVNLANYGVEIDTTSTIASLASFISNPQVKGTITGGIDGLTFNPSIYSGADVTYVTLINANPDIDEVIDNFSILQMYGYGDAAPKNVTGITIQPNFDGVGEYYTGINLFPNYDISQNGTGINFSSSNEANAMTGININLGGDYVSSAVGIQVNTDSATVSGGGRPLALSLSGAMQVGATFRTINSYPFFVDSAMLFGANQFIDNGSPLSGTDVLSNNLVSSLIAHDDWTSGSPFGIGWNSTAYVSQVYIQSGYSVDVPITMSLAAASIPFLDGMEGGTADEIMMYAAMGLVPSGGSIVVNDLYAFRAFGFLSTFSPTNLWGISIEDGNAENFFEKSLAIGTATKKVSNDDIALEIGSDKGLVVRAMDETTRDGLTAVTGMVIFNTDTSAFNGYDGSSWVALN